ncbi:MAG TPA: hypothetical protein GX708_19800, partial [Gallicola sp.]|nr:hypothetical protein [Gallicola sp.]
MSSYIILAGCGNLILLSVIVKKRVHKIQALVLLTIFAGVITKILFTGDLTSGKSLFLITSNLGLALVLNQEMRFKRILYAFLSFIFIYYSYFMINGTNVKLVQDQMSKNHININIIFAVALLLIIVNKNRKRPYINIILSTLAFVISVWSQGRGGIIATGILVVFILLDSFKDLSVKFKMLISTIVLMVLLYAIKNNMLFDSYFEVFYRKEFTTDIRFS